MATIRIGNAAGFWGDWPAAPKLLAEAGRLDYLTLEYLAELTMSILAHQRGKDSSWGFVSDFPQAIGALAPSLRQQPRLRIITNAGGMNPAGCAQQTAAVLKNAGPADVAIGIVAGDDLLPRLDGLLAAGESLSHADTGEGFDAIRPRVVSANAYLGAAPIVDALSGGARIVITGRVADASLTVGPAAFEFGWALDDWPRLAAATLAGHLIECGAQVTGGMFSGWTPDLPLENVGYPIAEMSADGGVVITKPASTGGCVTIGTVSEQLVYEIGNPAHYLTPDVDLDLTQVRLEQAGPDRVRVSNAYGRPAPERYKVSIAFEEGYMVAVALVVAGPNAREKARRSAEIVLDRSRRGGCEPAQAHVECLGSGDLLPGVIEATLDPPEVVLRIAARDPSRERLQRFMRELPSLVTSGPPGITGYTGPRPRPYRVLSYWPTSVARELVPASVRVQPATVWLQDGK